MPEPVMVLLADRVLALDSAPAIDLATGRPVHCDRIVCGTEAEARAWLDRGARRLAWWHSHLRTWIDVARVAARELLVLRDGHARCAGPGVARRLAVSWLREHDVDTTVDESSIGEPDRTGIGVRPRQARAIGLELSSPSVVGRLADLAEAAGEPTRYIAIDSLAGAGLSTGLRLLARELRLRGACPLAPVALARHPQLTRLLAGRTVVLLHDRDAVAAADQLLWAALVALRRAAIAVPLVVTAGWHPARASRLSLPGGSDTLADRATLWPALPPSRRRDLVRRADGLPGRLVERWLGDAAPRAEPAWRTDRGPAAMMREARPGWPAPPVASALPGTWRLLELGYADRARRAFERALAAMPCWPLDVRHAVDVLRGAGEAALAGGRPDLAIRDLDLARMIAANHALEVPEQHAQSALLRACLVQGRCDRAATLAEAVVTIPAGSSASPEVALVTGALAAATGDLAAAWSIWSRLSGDEQPGEVRGAALLELARLRVAVGDWHGAREAWGRAVPAVRRSRAWPLWWRIRLIRLALERSAGGRAHARHVARDRARLARGDVPPLVRVLAQYAVGGVHGGREVARFVERWGDGALRGLGLPIQIAHAGETRMIRDLQAILEICRDSDDSRAALVETVARVRVRLDAAAVLLHAASGQRLASVGVDRGEGWRIATRALECGGAVPAHDPLDGVPCAAAIVRFAGQALGVLVCRWTVASSPDRRDAELLLAGAATAMAPHVHVLRELASRERVVAGDSLGLLGASPAIGGLRERIRRVAAAPFHVLIEGESGSGKELVARALHATGPRQGRRFCAVNCAALTDELLEAELFGHARGAFTGAVGDRAGLFEEADGGTLFLDEVGELSLRAQAKLLRVIQDGEVRRVGETFARRAEARIVAATNRTLSDEVAAGRFRADLLYRLDVIRILVPSLRERPDDVVIIAKACWREATDRLGSRAQLHPATVAALARYQWPGNVRELQNVVRALAVNAPARGFVRPASLPAAIAAASGPPSLTLDAARRGFEERFVRAALARAGQRPSQAARDLGVSRQGLRKLIQRLGIADRPLHDVPSRG